MPCPTSVIDNTAVNQVQIVIFVDIRCHPGHRPRVRLQRYMSRFRNTQQEKEGLQHRIRGLTTILHGFAQQGPSKRPRDFDSFLRHFTTLLTCSSKYDAGPQRVIAVTGSIDPGQKVRTLIVENSHPNSPMGAISLHLVQKRHRSLDEVVAGYCSHGFECITIC